MDCRLDARFPAHFEATVTDLEHSRAVISGEIADISGAGIGVMLPVELMPGNTIKMEIAGSVLFGHVVYSNAVGAQFRTGIEIVRVLFGENDISRLLHTVLEQQMPGLVSARL